MWHRVIVQNRNRNASCNNKYICFEDEATVTATTTHIKSNRLYTAKRILRVTQLSFARAVKNCVVSFRHTELL